MTVWTTKTKLQLYVSLEWLCSWDDAISLKVINDPVSINEDEQWKALFINMGHLEDITQFSVHVRQTTLTKVRGVVKLMSTKKVSYFIIIFSITMMRKICWAINSTSLLSCNSILLIFKGQQMWQRSYRLSGNGCYRGTLFYINLMYGY